MSQSQNQNPFQIVFNTYENIAECIHTRFSSFFPSSSSSTPSTSTTSVGNLVIAQPSGENLTKSNSARPVTKEELGRSTWTMLHTLAAQFPDRPTRQQKKDVKELMAILSRLYPCKECADHFKEVLRLVLKLSFLNGYVMCIILSTEAWASLHFPVNGWMQDGVNWIAKNVRAILKEITNFDN
ncbi:FAD-linked sulfhydryl oxidase ERV1-like isoform X2 [Papaver somniferum]|uniref:FAD-linked sulfhydryl oxidase ERV1-like isoform X2 n=1 Tax=Papaver somniferum TaxID=3469 RepID=UPI000E7010C4|nr:FAD-linked sulfhydryl oxidase ERV1-like isoform X2 [Papaver somniferum]